MSKRVKDWRNRTKDRIVESMGGKCCLCGYDLCKESLVLHHLDPTKKEFGLGSIRANPKSWDKIVAELRKCILVCSNCHGEIHYNSRIIPNDVFRFDELFADYKLMNKELFGKRCEICGDLIPNRQKTCSYKCAAILSTRKSSWTDERHTLLKQYVLDKRTWVSIGLEFGLSDVAVKKRAIKLGLVT